MTERARLFETERLYASRWIPERDAEAAFAIYGDPEVARFIGMEPSASVEAQQAWLVEVIERYRGRETMGGFPVVRRSDDRIVGAVLLKPLPDGDGNATEAIEVGWHLARAHWGKGYATEAGRGVLRYGFEQLGLPTLHAVVDPDNARSIAVATRLPMQAQGRTSLYYGASLELFSLDASAFAAGASHTGESVIT